MAKNTFLYTAELDFPVADRDRFVEWFAYRHAPDLFRLGMKSCASYRAVEGGLDILDVYDMDDTQLFGRPEYPHMRVRDPYDADATRTVIREAATIYTQRVVMPAADEIPVLDADWISMLRFEAEPKHDEDIVAWLLSAEGPRQLALGASRLRYGFRSYDHPTLPTHRPRCFALAEWPHHPPTDFVILTQLFADRAHSFDFYVGQRRYPWPDEGNPTI